MNLIEFEGSNVVIAEHQPQYRPMPARRELADRCGIVTCCWQLTPEEIAEVARTGVIWHQMLTFDEPVQPQLLSTVRPF